MIKKAILLAVLVTAAPLQAEVTNTADNGFTVRHQTKVSASAEDVWKAMIVPSRYWNPDHSWTGKGENFYLVPQAGGCFCELIRTTGEDNIKSSDGSVQHMRVIYAQKNKMLRMSGGLGPLQGEAVVGTLTMQMQPQDGETAIRFTYKIGGYMEFPVAEIAPAVDGVIGEQLTRLAGLFKVEEATEETPDETVAEEESAN